MVSSETKLHTEKDVDIFFVMFTLKG